MSVYPRGTDRGPVAAALDAEQRSGGMPMRVLALERPDGTRARCAGFDGIPVSVRTGLVRPLEPGAVVLVSGDVALARLDTEWQ
jgi:hypothetical protein